MGWFSKWFATSEKAVDAGIDGIVNGLDKAILTKEEAQDFYLQMIKQHFDENTSRSLSRRMIAWAVVFTVLAVFWLCVALSLSPFASAIDKVIELVQAFELGWAFCTVIVFYFGPTLLGLLNSKKSY